MLLEVNTNLLAGSTVDAGISDICLPVLQMTVLLSQRVKLIAGKSVILDIFHPAFDFTLVTGSIGPGRQDDCTVMAGKCQEFGMDLRIIPVGMDNRRLEIIDDDRLRHTAEIPKGILQASDEGLGVLMPDDFTVSLAGEAQNYPKDVRTPLFPVGKHYRSTFTEIDLNLFARPALHPAKRHRTAAFKTAYETLDTVITAGKTMLIVNILPYPLGTKAGLELLGNDGTKRLAGAFSAWKPGGRNGRF